MSKIDLESTSSGFQSSASLQRNFTALEAELQDKVLYRDNPTGEPNQMVSDLDMNSQRILNLPTATQAGEAVPFEQASSFLTSVAYSGTLREIQIATAAQTVFSLQTLTYDPGLSNIQVYVEPSGTTGALMYLSTDYTETSGSSITFTTGLSAGDTVLFIVNADPLSDGNTNVDPDSILSQTIINNISLGAISIVTGDLTIDNTMAYSYQRITTGVGTSIYVPEDSSSNILVGTEVTIRLGSATACIVVPLGGVTVNPPAGGTLELGGQGATVTLKKIGVDNWDLIGQVFAA